MFCTIYKITNNFNNKIYIGQTWKPMLKRFIDHCNPNSKCSKLRNAIQKHGKENFKIEFITCTTTKETANELEMYFIQKYNSIKSGYNITEGGNGSIGFIHSENSKIKMSNSHKGKITWNKGTKGICKPNSGSFVKGCSPNAKSFKGKLTFEEVNKIREEYKLGNITQKELSNKYSLDQAAISRILNNKTYKL